MGKVTLHPVREQLLRLESRIEELEGQAEAYELALVCLLLHQPGDKGSQFLARKATELQRDRKKVIAVQTIDVLIEAVSLLRDAPAPPPQTQS